VRPALFIALALAWTTGCEGVLPDVDLQQMIDQHKFQPYEACRFFPDGRAMQPPPAGTVPRDRVLGHPDVTEGVVAGRYVEHVPLPVTAALFATGRFAFDTWCAACHGVDGSGDSAVADNMELRRPPSLVDARVRAFPDGRIFQVATHGYGLMPAYDLELSTRERWAVVAYLRALQLSQGIALDELPPPLRATALHALTTPDPPEPSE
jgi:mono/diheme cytochrome c family protein